MPIERVDVFQTVLRRLEGWLRETDLEPGDRLPSERALAERLGVSRGSVRQALKVLISLGRLEQRHGSGTYVKNRAQDPVALYLIAEAEGGAGFCNEVAQVRASLDALAVRTAASRITSADIAGLRDFLERREGELAKEPAAPGSLDHRFEAELGRIGGNKPLQRLQAAIHDLYLHAWAEQGMAPADSFKLHDEHLEILDALEHGASERAEQLMYAHVARRAESASSHRQTQPRKPRK